MKYLPYVDLQKNQYNMGLKEDICLIVFAYISICLYLVLIAIAIQNVYKFLYKQKKYKVYPVTLFYIFAIPNLILRVSSNIFVV